MKDSVATLRLETRQVPVRATDWLETAYEKRWRKLYDTFKIAVRSLTFYMNVPEQIKKYIASQPEPKRSDMQELHRLTLQVLPGCKLWFLDGKNSENQTVSNPNIGYGLHTMKYANGATREFYQIGMSANKTGISVYIMGLEDKTYLAQTYGEKIGKASVSGYCIKFKTLKDINVDVLEAAIRHGLEPAEHSS